MRYIRRKRNRRITQVWLSYKMDLSGALRLFQKFRNLPRRLFAKVASFVLMNPPIWLLVQHRAILGGQLLSKQSKVSLIGECKIPILPASSRTTRFGLFWLHLTTKHGEHLSTCPAEYENPKRLYRWVIGATNHHSLSFKEFHWCCIV